MNFNRAVKILNSKLRKEQPQRFGSTWIYRGAPKVYRYVWANVRTELGDIDWDKVVSKLDSPFQRRWYYRRSKRVKTYRNIREVRTVLNRYQDKLYVFIAPADESDKYLRDTISIALVRVAQKGNLRAQQELITMLRYIVDQWIEYCPKLWRWKGYAADIEDKLKGCIRCYRFTGSFVGYMFKTFEYAGRGLRSSYSLDEFIGNTDKRRIDNVVQDADTNEIHLYQRLT